MKKEHEIAGTEMLGGFMKSVGVKQDKVNPACVPPVDPTVASKKDVYGHTDHHKSTSPDTKRKKR